MFTWDDYKWGIDGSDSNFSKYTKASDKLELEDDAAHVNMGGSWHMPTPDQINELIDNTKNTRTTQDGINGRLFTSKNNGKSIFIPEAGFAWDGSLKFSGSNGYVWSSTLGTSNVDSGQDLNFFSYTVCLKSSYRIYGFSVRGVLG